MNPSFQFTAELTRVIPVRQAIEAAGAAIIKFARELRASGSDIVVEEDLADIFGRGRISGELESRFKESVSKGGRITPYRGSLIELDAGPGPTVTRALRDRDRGYLATIIQLSFLGWTHIQDDLTSSLVWCMNKQYQLGVPRASVNSGFDGIKGTLEACSSQTSCFDWNMYLRQVEHRFERANAFSEERLPSDTVQRYSSLSDKTFLAFMDYLYSIQRFPEEMFIAYGSLDGSIILTVWVHFILGLTVSVQLSNGSQILFRTDQPSQVGLGNQGDMLTAANSSPDEVILFNSKMEVVLRTDSDESSPSFMMISPQERHHLQDFGYQLI